MAHILVNRTIEQGVTATLAPADLPGLQKLLADRHESAADLRSLYRGVLFVEGSHDELILGRWLDKAIDRLGLLLMPLYQPNSAGNVYGADRSGGEVLCAWELVGGPVCYILDNTRRDPLKALLREVRGASSVEKAERLAASAAGSFSDKKDAFGSSFANVLAAAARAGCVKRVSIRSLSKDDISEYLPCKEVTNGRFQTWEEAKRDARRANQSRPLSGKELKRYIGGVTYPNLKRVLARHPRPPGEDTEFIDIEVWLESMCREATDRS